MTGRSRPATSLTGDSAWQSLAAEFQVTADPEEVELVCELRASAGEVWFEEDSLCLVRIR